MQTTANSEMTVGSAAAYLLRGIHLVPLGFLWGLVALFPIAFVMAFDRYRAHGKTAATICGILGVAFCSVAIIALVIPFAFNIAQAVAEEQEDAFGFKAIRESFRGPAKDAIY